MDHVRNGKNGDYISNNKVDNRSSQVLEEIRHAEAVQTLQRAKIEAVRKNQSYYKIHILLCDKNQNIFSIQIQSTNPIA